MLRSSCLIFKKIYNVYMIEEKHIKEKRIELIWALSLQDYTHAQIGRIFNIDRSTVLRIISKKPRNWSSKWHKTK